MGPLNKPLTVCYWNADGISRDYNILYEFLEEYTIDILLINETRTTPNKRFSIKNYNVYRNDGPRAPHGGTAVLIKSSLHHRHIPTPSFSNLEGTFIEIPINNLSLQFGAIYCSPNLKLLDSDLTLLHSMSNNYVHAGDFNAKNTCWNSRITTTRGRQLEAHATLFNYNVIAPITPTHFPYNNEHLPDVLDIAIINSKIVPIHIESLPALTSNHNPVLLVLDHIPASGTLKSNISTAVNWSTFRSYLNHSIPESVSINSQEELDEAIETYINTIKFAMKTATNYLKVGNNELINTELKKLCQQKRRARKQWQKTRNIADKNLYNNLKNKLHRRATEIKIDKFQADVKDAASSNAIWKITKRLTQPISTSKQQPILSPTGFKYNPNEKADAIADYLETHFEEPPPHPQYVKENEHVIAQVKNFINSPYSSEIQNTTPSEVKTIIKSLKSSKSPGPDKISNLILKNLPQKTVCHITQIFNFALALNYFPTKWKHAHIITIPKPKKSPNLPENRRPISLLDTHGKIFEKIILRRLAPFTEKVIPPWQTAFQKGKCINHCVLALVEDVIKGFNSLSYTAAVFLDVKKAFDSVWHTGLLYKISKYLSPSLTILIASYLQNRTFQVKIDGSLSSTRNAIAGVPQGSVLGPILYCLYMADIPTSTRSSILMYADDTTIYYTSFNPTNAVMVLQEHINLMLEWYNFWRTSINPEKSKSILFTKCRKRPLETIHINNTEIPFAATVKYLGVHLDSKLLFHKHIEDTKSKGNGRISQIYPLLKSPVLSLKRKIVLYKMLVLPILTYAAPVWCHLPRSVLNPLQVVQNRALKIIHASDWYTRTVQIHQDLEVKFLDIILKNQVTKFYEKTKNSELDFIKNLGHIDPRKLYTYKMPKSFIL